MAPGTLLAGSSDRNLYQAEAKAESKAESNGKGSDWITQIAISPSGRVAVAEVGGKVHFPQATAEAGNANATRYTIGNDAMKATSGVWALLWNTARQGDEQVLVGTRKNGVLVAGRSWKWTEPAKEEALAPASTEAEETKPEKEVKKEEPEEKAKKPELQEAEPAKPAPEKPVAEKPAETEKKE